MQAGGQRTIRRTSCHVFLLQTLRKDKEGITALAYPGEFITQEIKSLNFGTEVLLNSMVSPLISMACVQCKASRDSPSVYVERTCIFISRAHRLSPDIRGCWCSGICRDTVAMQ